MTRLRGKRVLLTGATSGIGLAAVERFAAAGADLALLARGEAALAEAAAVAREHGGAVHVFPVDLGDRAAAEAAVAGAVAALGGLDVLVSNAGAVAFGHFLEVPPDDFDRTVQVTFTGAVNVIRAALPELRATRGTLVATSSIMARMPLPAFSSYTAAKHALRGFLNAVQVEEREQRTGVRVALVAPGPTDTPIYARATSATGRAPAILPDAYHADEVAAVLVESAVRPRRERIVGGESRLVDLGYRTARPVVELLLVHVDRWFRTGTGRRSADLVRHARAAAPPRLRASAPRSPLARPGRPPPTRARSIDAHSAPGAADGAVPVRNQRSTWTSSSSTTGRAVR